MSDGPEIFYLNSVNFALGNNFNSPQGRDFHRYPISDNLTWQKNSHQVKFGGEWERVNAVGYWGFFYPARAYLLSPEFLASISPALPALFGLPDGIIHTQDDLKKLPVAAFLSWASAIALSPRTTSTMRRSTTDSTSTRRTAGRSRRPSR